jgi:hypothetical protein
MKKLLLLVLVVSVATLANAQHIRLNFYSNYVFDDGFGDYISSNNYYSGTIKGGYQIGGGIQYMAGEGYSTELLYLHKNTKAPSSFRFGNLAAEKHEDFDVRLQYIMLSGDRNVKPAGGKAEVYGGMMAGVLISKVEAPSTGNSGSNTNFAWGARLGSNIWASDKIGLKLQAMILSAVNATGGDVYYGYWGPVAVPDYSVLWQFSLGGGLVFRLGK